MKKHLAKKSNALSDRVYDRIYSDIVRGRFAPGERITEMQIAEAEGVSQAPVREALKRLAADRLVTLVPRSGCYVCKLTRDDADCLFEIRKRLECLGLEYAFERFDMSQVKALHEKLQECLKMVGARFVRQEMKLDAQFHELIRKSSGSVDLETLSNALWAKVQLFRIREAMDMSRVRAAINQHINILGAILSGDKTKAIRLLEEHIEQSRKTVLERYVDDKVGE